MDYNMAGGQKNISTGGKIYRVCCKNVLEIYSCSIAHSSRIQKLYAILVTKVRFFSAIQLHCNLSLSDDTKLTALREQ